MKHLLNTLYILSEDIYLSLDGENVVANRDKQIAARYPLHTLQNNGRLCGTADRICVLQSQRKIPGEGMWGGERKRSAPPDAIPDCGRSSPVLPD